MTIREQVNERYVGEFIELYDIDLNPIGVNQIIRLTPHSETNILWRGNTYVPFPIMASGSDRATNQAPGRVTLSASTASTVLTAVMLQYGDLVGAKVRRWRTLSLYLDGKPTADPNQHFPIEEYIIINRDSLSQEGISWTLANTLDKPGLVIPRRQCLRDIASRASLYCPGMSRAGVRSR